MNQCSHKEQDLDQRSSNKMAFNYDFAITAVVIIFLILGVWAKMSKQTIAEVIGDIKDIFSGGGEEVEGRVGEIIEYE